MGVSLTYQPLEASTPEATTQIFEEAQKVAEDREWWCEPLFFLSPESLDGATKIFLPGYSTGDGGYVEVDAEEDSLMAAYDTQFILDTLTQWSKRFQINWAIGIDGDEIGIVSAEGPDPMLLGMVAAVATHGDSDEMPDFDEQEIMRIRKKYASRL